MSDCELEEFLAASELCDSDHPLVKATAERVTCRSGTQKDTAIKIFYFVRDRIPLAFVHPWKTASQTLNLGRGSCFTKATLQVALLRSVKVPARFRIVEFRGDDVKEWKGIVPAFGVSLLPERYPHYFAEVYVEGRWVKADATFDKALVPDVEDWNGEKDVCSIAEKAMLYDLGFFVSVEDEARKLDERYRIPVLLRMNSFRFFWILNLYQKAQRFRKRF